MMGYSFMLFRIIFMVALSVVLLSMPRNVMAQAACGISFGDDDYDYDDGAVADSYVSRVSELGYVPDDITIEEGQEAYEAGYFDEAFVIFQSLALKGDAAAYYYMGRLYDEGDAPNGRDEEAAIELYELAARAGNVDASLWFLSRDILRGDEKAADMVAEIGGREAIFEMAEGNPAVDFIKGAMAHLAGDNIGAIPFLEKAALGEGEYEDSQNAMILLARIYCSDYEGVGLTAVDALEKAETLWGRLNLGQHDDDFIWAGFTCDAADFVSDEVAADIRARVISSLDAELLSEEAALDEESEGEVVELGYGEIQDDGSEIVAIPFPDE